jgi:hypothetical protein
MRLKQSQSILEGTQELEYLANVIAKDTTTTSMLEEL